MYGFVCIGLLFLYDRATEAVYCNWKQVCIYVILWRLAVTLLDYFSCVMWTGADSSNPDKVAGSRECGYKVMCSVCGQHGIVCIAT